MSKKFNPDLMCLARESRGLSQKALAELMRVGQGQISKIENGFSDPSEEILHNASQVLKYPVGFFYQDCKVFPGLSYHRKRQSLPKKVFNKLTARTNIIRMGIQNLLKSVDVPDLKIPSYHPSEFNNSPERIAECIRKVLCLPRGPIDNLTRILENAGVFISHVEFETRFIDGLTIYLENYPPIIFISRNIPGDRLRFTLAHELAHLVMHKTPNPDYMEMEKEADLFASEFLMPAEDISVSLNRLNLAKLGSLKQKWKTSMAAIIKKAATLGKLSPRQERYMIIKMNQLGVWRQEPKEFDIPKEQPTLLKEIIDAHIKELNYSISEVCNILNVMRWEFEEQFYNSENRNLRIIK